MSDASSVVDTADAIDVHDDTMVCCARSKRDRSISPALPRSLLGSARPKIKHPYQMYVSEMMQWYNMQHNTCATASIILMMASALWPAHTENSDWSFCLAASLILVSAAPRFYNRRHDNQNSAMKCAHTFDSATTMSKFSM